MPGTLLLDDLRDSIGQQLGDYASGLTQAATAAVQPIAAAIPTPQTPDPNQILQELQQHAAAAAQAAQEQAQPALQVLGGAQQAAGGAVTQLGQTRDQVQQQLQQHVDNVTSDVGQQLQDHVNTVLGSTTPSQPGGVQSLAKPTPTPMLGAPPADQNAPPVLGGTTGAVNQPAAPPDRSMSLQDYARAAAQRAGIDPNVFVAQIQQESGFSPTDKNGQPLKSPAGAIGIAQFMPDTAKGVGLDPTDPYASLDAAARMDAQKLQDYGGDWGKVLASYNAGPGAVAEYNGIPPYAETQSYVKTIMGNAQNAAAAAGTTISNVVQAGQQAVSGAAQAVTQKVQDLSQFGDKQLSADEAYAACGPAAAVRFAERFGRNPTLREATDLAKQVGWTASGGMAGIQSEQQLLSNMGVDTHIVAPDWDAIAKEAQTGNPVTISTPGHYYFADGYNAETGAFHVGQSGLDLRQGSEWMTPAQMESLMGKAQGALFADNPNVPAKGAAGAPTTLGGTTGTQNAPITLGGPAPARAPLYADTNQPATPIQSAADVVGVGASALGTAAQQALAQAQEINRIQPGTEALKAATPVLGGAVQSGTAAVNQVAQDVQNAAQGVLGAAQDVNRLTPGATAVQAAAPVLGAAASDVGAGARAAADTAGQTLGGSADQVRQQVQDTIDSLPSNATVAQARSAIGDTLDALGPRALEVAGNLPLPMGGTVSDLQAPLRGAQAGLQTVEEQRQAQLNRPDPVQQFQDNVDAARRGDWGAFAQGTLALAQRPFEPIMGGPEADISQAVSAALTAGGIDANAARVLGQVANVIGPMLLERAIPEVVSAAARGADAAVNAGLEAIDRLAPPEVALATTRRAGESADDYLARLSDEAAVQRPSTDAGQLVGPRGEPLRTAPPETPTPTAAAAPLSPGPRPPIASAAGVPEDARSVYAMTSNGSLEQAAAQSQADMQRLQSVRNGLASDTGPRYDNAGNPMNSAARDFDLGAQARVGATRVPPVETPSTPSGARPISMTTPEQVARLRLQDFPSEVQQTIQDAASSVGWANAQRRGVIPDRVANNLADELANSTSLNHLIDQYTPGQAFNTEQLRAIRNAIGGQGVKVSDLAAAISGGDKSLETAQQFLTEGDKLQRLVQLAEGGRAEAGRAMRAFQAPSTLQNLAPEQATSEIASRLARNPDQLAQAVANYQQLVDSGADPIKLAAFWNSFKAPPVTGMDWFKALRYNSMISGVPTIERIGITGALENLYGIAREGGSALVRGQTGEAAAIAKGAWLGFLKGGQNARDTLIHGINEDQALAGGFPRGIAGRVSGPLASGPIRGPIAQRAAQALELPGRLHSALQDVTQGTAYGMRMYQRAAQDADRLKLSGDAAAQHIAEFVNSAPLTQRGRAAMQDAATFGQRAAMRGEMGTFGSALTNVQQAGPIGHLVLPFARVAYNVGVRGIDRSPLGLLGTTADVIRTGGRYARANNQAAVEALGLRGVRPFNERLTDNAIGTLLTGAAYLEAKAGNVTGAGPSDVNQRDLLQSQGWQPYSLRIGGNYVPYRVLGPWAIPLALAASGAEAQTYAKAGQGPDDPLSLLGDAARRSGEFAANETYLRDIGSIMRGIQQPDRYGNQFISDMASSVLPYGALLGNVAQATSGVQRQTSSPTGTPLQQAALNTLTSRIPGLANQLPARQDVLGRPMPSRAGAGFAPETPTSNPGDAVLSELTSHGVAVPTQNKVATAGQAEAQLTPGQQRAVQTYAGTLIQQNVTQLMADPSYRTASNADQSAMLARAVSAARAAAEREMLSRLPADQLKPARQVTITVPVAQRVPLPVP